MDVTPLLSVTQVDHVGITVPDLAEAHDFLVGVLGCEYMYRLGPYRDDDGPWMREHLGVDERTVMERLHFYSLGGQAVFDHVAATGVQQAMIAPGRAARQVAALDQQRPDAAQRQVAQHTRPGHPAANYQRVRRS